MYYQAGFDDFSGDLDNYFGAFNVIAGGYPRKRTLVHQRVNDFAGSSVYDYTYNDTIALSGNTYNSGTKRGSLLGSGDPTQASTRSSLPPGIGACPRA